ncbi:MAG: hypothetical protein HY039_12820 [Nitrospirae bacterium]|nr:hypothetical protein [Nitrospirota bacterium]
MGKTVRCLGGTCAGLLLLVLGAAAGGYLVHSWYTTGQTVDRIARWIPGAQAVGDVVSRTLGVGEAGVDLLFSREEEFPSDAPLPAKVSSKRFHISRRAGRPATAYLESPLGSGEMASYYERALAEKGWKAVQPGLKADGETLYVASKEGRLLSVWIGTRKEAGSFVMLSVGRAAGSSE